MEQNLGQPIAQAVQSPLAEGVVVVPTVPQEYSYNPTDFIQSQSRDNIMRQKKLVGQPVRFLPHPLWPKEPQWWVNAYVHWVNGVSVVCPAKTPIQNLNVAGQDKVAANLPCPICEKGNEYYAHSRNAADPAEKKQYEQMARACYARPSYYAYAVIRQKGVIVIANYTQEVAICITDLWNHRDIGDIANPERGYDFIIKQTPGQGRVSYTSSTCYSFTPTPLSKEVVGMSWEEWQKHPYDLYKFANLMTPEEILTKISSKQQTQVATPVNSAPDIITPPVVPPTENLPAPVISFETPPISPVETTPPVIETTPSVAPLALAQAIDKASQPPIIATPAATGAEIPRCHITKGGEGYDAQDAGCKQCQFASTCNTSTANLGTANQTEEAQVAEAAFQESKKPSGKGTPKTSKG